MGEQGGVPGPEEPGAHLAGIGPALHTTEQQQQAQGRFKQPSQTAQGVDVQEFERNKNGRENLLFIRRIYLITFLWLKEFFCMITEIIESIRRLEWPQSDMVEYAWIITATGYYS